jgi:glycine/D-amino acid oxidase-like deaminating enzyme
MQARFEEISPWVKTPDDLQPPLRESIHADVVVIGGGYTGLSTALSLRAQGTDVVVLEQGFAGSGASGRNAGHLTPTIGKDIPTLLRIFGQERARNLVRFADAAVDYTEHIIRNHAIDCEYEPNGNILAGLHPKHDSRLRKAAETAQSLGAHVQFLSPEEMRERGLPRTFRCGVLEERGGILHPGKYVMGLRAAALKAGVRLFEQSALTRLSPGAKVVAATHGGTVTAGSAVLATNAYTKTTGWKPRLVAPLRVSLFETEPLTERQLAALDWHGREGIYTAHEALESYRLTARRTIVGGSKLVRYAWDSELPPAHDPGAFIAIHLAFRERFPSLRDVSMARYWGGWIGLTLDFLPAIGSEGPNRNVFYGVGYAGHGVAQATLMGAMLAERVQGREHEWEVALRRTERSWPPEPLRWMGAKLLNGAVRAMDYWTDIQIRRLGPLG